MIHLDRPLPQIDRETALADYDRYVRAVPIDAITKALNTIENAAIETDLTEEGGERAAIMAGRALRDGAPFSLVRIGDGEGNILGALDPDFASARHFSTRAILEMMFGTADFTAEEVQTAARTMRAAVLSADVLGVSDHIRISRLRALRHAPEGRDDIRGYMGSYESVLQVSSLLARTGSRPPLVVSNHVHRHMMPEFPDIIAAARQITLIGPYDLREAFARVFGCSDVRVCLIPNQASSSPGEGGKWYPERYLSLLERLDISAGGLFLISAGVLGKALCAAVKAGGGVALDIGSVADVWHGKPVRKYHDADFLTRFQLFKPTAG